MGKGALRPPKRREPSAIAAYGKRARGRLGSQAEPTALCGARLQAYTQHYFDSRGVARVYAMSFSEGVWTLLRETSDFTPLDFSQRFTGTFSDDGKTIAGRWESRTDASSWEHDFDLTYAKVR